MCLLVRQERPSQLEEPSGKEAKSEAQTKNQIPLFKHQYNKYLWSKGKQG